ncbi:2-succinyl-6-hydroxy-2,4-cyclohexadiene-1-carboxy late synthase [Actinocatenispora thailandica]|uniref:2-succinyl-6-hydroxy-2,4-cyclohexadiene-1-carboxy late synthase n=1 Tax=Actinocatenispora thailandica TaxID=227318 RepID=A0A7R7HVW9_9ACTN|nr:alpha/beta hydrolase [Actinocatenispora thailandica]BCJ33518.1 2-succinyl-6-hydroxy-2,4-cyclohexadiene-1-carboxy late synthase [Actinocatenispora thailandica]
MPSLQTSAGRVAYSDTGAGPLLVLLHATLHDRHDFDPVLPALATRHRVIAVDWPGHGDSDADAGGRPVTAPLLADVLEEVVLAQDLRGLRLIGNSVGGFAAARLAIRHPDRVTGLVLVDSGGFAGHDPVSRTLFRAIGTPAIAKRLMPRFVPGYMKPRTASDREIVARTVARARTGAGAALAASMWRSFATAEHDLHGQADRLTAPTMIVWGRRDTAAPLRAGRATHRYLPNATMEVLDTGHVVFSSDPRSFLRVVEPFLAALPDGPASEHP